MILTLFQPCCLRQNTWKAHLLPLHLTHYYLVAVMIVPGHVVFLWRIIHQHFTLAFLKHISTCCCNKSPRPLENSSVTKKSRSSAWSVLSVFPLEELAATHEPLRSLGLFLQQHILEAFCANSLFIHRGARSWRTQAFSPPFNHAQLTIRFVSVRLVVFGAFLRSLDHLDLSSATSLLPYIPHAPGPVKLLPW